MRWNIWASNSEAGPSKPVPDANTPGATAPPDATASTPKPASSSSGPAPEPASMLNRFERTLDDEEKYQAQQFPSFDDVPGCMQLFDEFMMCYAMVPQLRNMYRHGELRDCTYKFHDFKYCMSLKGDDVETRRKLWIKRKAEWWAARRVGQSSEDVWDMRTEPLENFPPLHPEAAENMENL